MAAVRNLFSFGFKSNLATSADSDAGKSQEDEYEAELCSTVSPESDDESHLQPPLKKTKRKFQTKWMEKWPWVRHNPEEDVMFCATCREVPTLIINRKTTYLLFFL